jgi:hypothetical protein
VVYQRVGHITESATFPWHKTSKLNKSTTTYQINYNPEESEELDISTST